MGFFALFVCLLGAAILLVFAAGNMPAATLAKVVRYTGGGLLAVVTLFLGLTGRLGLAIPAGMASYALFRGDLGRLGSLGRGFPGMGGGSGRGPSQGQSSDIETDWLTMWLDHDSGEMGGRVRQGRYEGAELQNLSEADVMALRSELVRDADSLRLLDSYIERVYGGAGEAGEGTYQDTHSQSRQEQPSRSASGMSRDEAYEVLGLSPGAGIDDIKKAHRNLMQKFHPDKGGSSYQAAKLNQAKDILLAAAKA